MELEEERQKFYDLNSIFCEVWDLVYIVREELFLGSMLTPLLFWSCQNLIFFVF